MLGPSLSNRRVLRTVPTLTSSGLWQGRTSEEHIMRDAFYARLRFCYLEIQTKSF